MAEIKDRKYGRNFGLFGLFRKYRVKSYISNIFRSYWSCARPRDRFNARTDQYVDPRSCVREYILSKTGLRSAVARTGTELNTFLCFGPNFGLFCPFLDHNLAFLACFWPVSEVRVLRKLAT